MAARWSRREDAELRAHYARGIAVKEIGRRLERSADAVDARRRALGLPSRRPARRMWTRAHDDLLRASAEARVAAPVVAEILGLPVEAVRRRRAQLSPTPRARLYEVAELDDLRTAVERGEPLREVARRLGRSEAAVRLRARESKLITTQARRRWTFAEDELVREGYEQGLTCDVLAVKLLGGSRSTGAVAARARRLGVVTYARSWSADEEAALRSMVSAGVSVGVIAERLSRTPEAIRRRSHTLGVRVAADAAPNRGRPWTAREDEILRDLAALAPGRLAGLLGRSDLAVVRRMRVIGLATGSPHHLAPTTDGLTAGQLRLVDRLAGDGGEPGLISLARRLGRPPAALLSAARSAAH